MEDPLVLAELLSTKLAHEIIGPVGAICNGLEFMAEEMPDLNGQAFDLVNSSAKEASSRLKFYRQAFGQNTSDSSVSLTETRDVSQDFFSHGKIQLIWPDEATDMCGISITSYQRKLVLNLLVTASSCLIKGGQMEFSISNDFINITIYGEMVKIDDSTKGCLEGNLPFEKLDARSIQNYYTYMISKAAGSKLTVTKNSDSINFRIGI